MAYDRDSFLAGIAVGRNMHGWPDMEKYDSSAFSFTIITTETSLTYSFFITSFAGTVNWGDGTSEERTTSPQSMSISHTYTNPGLYRIVVSGNVEHPMFYGARASMLIAVNTPFPVPRLSSGTDVDNIILTDTFYGCTNLIYIPDNLLHNYAGKKLLAMRRMFRNCRSLSKIPDGFFDGLDADIEYPINASELFRGCRAIVEFPEDIFANPIFENLGSVENMFYGCTSLVHLPTEKLPFKKSTIFSGLCANCSSLQEIPDGLFDDCINLRNADSLFADCHSITEIPSGLFDNCPDMTTAMNSFLYTSITSIPSDLFAGKTALTSVSGAFRDTGITSVPGDIFAGCIALTSAEQTFYLCRNLVTIGQGLFSDSSNMNNLSDCFNTCVSVTSEVPELWLMFPNAQYHSSCFRGCTNAANYADIPSGWK